jgi:hypothetical protein
MGVFPNPDTRWVKGQSGNPRGRPKGRSFKATKALLARIAYRDDAVANALAVRVIDMALRGNIEAMKLLIAADEGEPVELRRRPQR